PSWNIQECRSFRRLAGLKIPEFDSVKDCAPLGYATRNDHTTVGRESRRMKGARRWTSNQLKTSRRRMKNLRLPNDCMGGIDPAEDKDCSIRQHCRRMSRPRKMHRTNGATYAKPVNHSGLICRYTLLVLSAEDQPFAVRQQGLRLSESKFGG